MWRMPDEDGYWERVREERESPHRYHRGYDSKDTDPVIEHDVLFLDEEQEKIEKEYNRRMEKLSMGELQEIVEERKEVDTLSAWWNAAARCISYSYEDKEAYAW